MVENVIAGSTLVPIASSIQICTTLLVPSSQIISITPFIRLTTLSQTPRDTSQFGLTPFFQIKFTCTFITNVSNCYRCKHLLSIGTATNFINIFSCSGCITLIELSFCTQQISFCQTEQIQVTVRYIVIHLVAPLN